MRALTLKLLRDVKALRGPAIATGLVVAAGLSVFVMSMGTLGSLRATRDGWYLSQHFADVFVRLERAPLALAARLAEVPGVAAVEPRVVAGGRLEVPGLPDPAVGWLVSLPAAGETALNRVHVRQGRLPQPGVPGEVLVGEAFAQANRLGPGSVLEAVVEGREQALRVVGVGLSPEFIYSIQPGQMLPDDRRFGVLWMARDELARLCGLVGAFNDACLRLAPGASLPQACADVDRILARHGGHGAHGRDQQASHQYLDGEIEQLRGMALVAPLVFLGVAAFLLHVALARLVGTQREQLATLKAFGYRDGEVARHCLGLAVVLVLPGVLLGLAVGAWRGAELTATYARFFRFPEYVHRVGPDVVLLGVGACALAAVVGTLGAVRRVVRMAPAEALQPEAPLRYRHGWMRTLGLAWLAGPVGRMVLRHMARRPVRTLLSGLGIALATALLVMGGFVQDVLDLVMDEAFVRGQRQDLSLALVEAAPGVQASLASLPGVRQAEVVRSVAVRLENGTRSQRVGLQGREPSSELTPLRDEAGRPLVLPRHGLVLSRPLARALGVRAGDRVHVACLEGERREGPWTVAAVSLEHAGLSAYAHREALAAWLGEQGLASGALLAVDRARLAEVEARLREAPRVGAIVVRRAALEAFSATVAENLGRMRTMNVLFASILAVGVVYNAARVSLAERSRDLATLRILGYTRGEISTVLLGELAVLVLLALPLGLVLGRGLSALVVSFFETEAYQFPLVITPPTYAWAALVTVGASLLAGLVVRRRLDRLDLVAVLKARE